MPRFLQGCYGRRDPGFARGARERAGAGAQRCPSLRTHLVALCPVGMDNDDALSARSECSCGDGGLAKLDDALFAWVRRSRPWSNPHRSCWSSSRHGQSGRIRQPTVLVILTVQSALASTVMWPAPRRRRDPTGAIATRRSSPLCERSRRSRRSYHLVWPWSPRRRPRRTRWSGFPVLPECSSKRFRRACVRRSPRVSISSWMDGSRAWLVSNVPRRDCPGTPPTPAACLPGHPHDRCETR